MYTSSSYLLAFPNVEEKESSRNAKYLEDGKSKDEIYPKRGMSTI